MDLCPETKSRNTFPPYYNTSYQEWLQTRNKYMERTYALQVDRETCSGKFGKLNLLLFT